MTPGDKIRIWVSDEFGNAIVFNAIVIDDLTVDILDLSGRKLWTHTLKIPLSKQLK